MHDSNTCSGLPLCSVCMRDATKRVSDKLRRGGSTLCSSFLSLVQTVFPRCHTEIQADSVQHAMVHGDASIRIIPTAVVDEASDRIEHIVTHRLKTLCKVATNPVDVALWARVNGVTRASDITQNDLETAGFYVIKRATGSIMARRKTPLNAYNRNTLARAITKCGLKGCRISTVVSEYPRAARDLARLQWAHSVFVSGCKVWHTAITGTPSRRCRKRWIAYLRSRAATKKIPKDEFRTARDLLRVRGGSRSRATNAYRGLR